MSGEQPAPKERVWNCAVYARLSLEDSGRKGADTIETQIELVTSYVAVKSYLSLTDTYIDNGASGKDFDRIAWNRLIDDIRAGRVDCVCVKDLSRFSRNYIETCEFLEKIFPFMGVRFVSVNDGYDNHATGSNNEGLIIALKSLVNDQYLRDISRKIHASVKAKHERGVYTRNYAPFGYTIVSDGSGKLEINLETAPIIRNIFKWRASGMSYYAICKALDADGIPTPNEYLRRKHDAFNSNYFKSTIWHPQTLKNILKNAVYIGTLEQGKKVQKLYEHKPCTCVPRELWRVTENSHEPIINRELFETVPKIEAATKATYVNSGQRPERTENIFKGFTVCGLCGAKMSRTYSKKPTIHGEPWECYYFLCPIKRQHMENGGSRSMREEVLINSVFPLVADKLSKAANLTTIIEKRAKNQTNPCSLLDKEIARISYELKIVNQRTSKLYEDYVDKLLDEREYVGMKSAYENRAGVLRGNIESLSQRAAIVADVSASNNRWMKAARDFQNPEKLTREMLEAIVERVEIFGHERVEVVWKFKDELELLAACVEMHEDADSGENIGVNSADGKESA